VIQGQGDPKLVLERLWLLLRRVQGLGIRTIAGDIVLDRSAFDRACHRPRQLRRRAPAAL
jgi:D-alanyl-D-alanine carboxypeptidase/D-alanyl-D-alanine-endopeptidase (penicillin-binding protein 4)